MKPTEGTILTVARESAEKAREMLHSTNDPIIIMEEVCKQAELSLNETPKLLPALAKAGVVDAGGKGLLIIFEAMRDVFKGGEIVNFTRRYYICQRQHTKRYSCQLYSANRRGRSK